MHRSLAIAAFLVVFGLVSPAWTQEAGPKLLTTQVALGTLQGENPRFFAVSPDGKYVVKAVKYQTKMAVVLNGVEGRKYDEALGGNFSPDGKRFAYKAKAGSKHYMVLDGKVSKPYDNVGSFYFSPDSEHFAYQACANKEYMVVLDGVEGKRYSSLELNYIAFSSDSKHIAYMAARRDKKAKHGWQAFVVKDGKEGPPYEYIHGGSLTFGPDSKQFAFVAGRNRKTFPVLNGKEGKAYDMVDLRLVFSPDGAHLACLAQEGTKYFVVIDGKEGPKYADNMPFDWPDGFAFSPDGKHHAYHIDYEHMVIDGVAKRYIEIGDPVYSPDGKHLAYTAVQATEDTPAHNVLVLDGVVKDLGFENMERLSFSPDGAHMVFLGFKNDKWTIVVDDKPVGSLAPAMAPVFSPDGKHLAYIGSTSRKEFVLVLDGLATGKYDRIPENLTFRDSVTVSAIAFKGNKAYYVTAKLAAP